MKLAIDVIDASADFLACTKRVIFVPIFHFILSIFLFALWVGAFGCVVSMNDISADTTVPQGKDLKWKPQVTYMALYMFFGILWILAFVDYCSKFVVIVSASTYYFNSNMNEEGDANVLLGF